MRLYRRDSVAQGKLVYEGLRARGIEGERIFVQEKVWRVTLGYYLKTALCEPYYRQGMDESDLTLRDIDSIKSESELRSSIVVLASGTGRWNKTTERMGELLFRIPPKGAVYRISDGRSRSGMLTR